jgi:hypothetical protein
MFSGTGWQAPGRYHRTHHCCGGRFMLIYLGIAWLGCAAIFLELADRAPLIEG